MAILSKCSACAKLLSVDEQFAGRRGRCPNCGQLYTIPDRSTFSSESIAKQSPIDSNGPAESPINPYADTIPQSDQSPTAPEGVYRRSDSSIVVLIFGCLSLVSTVFGIIALISGLITLRDMKLGLVSPAHRNLVLIGLWIAGITVTLKLVVLVVGVLVGLFGLFP